MFGHSHLISDHSVLNVESSLSEISRPAVDGVTLGNIRKFWHWHPSSPVVQQVI